MATACSVLLAEHSGQTVSLWIWEADHAREIVKHGENRRFLPGVRIPDGVQVEADIEQAMDGADLLVAAIPSAFLRVTLGKIAQAVPPERAVVSVIKGLEGETFLRPSEIIRDVLGPRPVVALSGPSHAEEIARRLPASVVAAGEDLAVAKRVQQVFNTDRFRVYTNGDIVGVELAGALKNVMAIAAGICDGLGYGDNAKSALMTRGLVEMTRFGTALGADPLTFSGLAGMGDLVTTCVSPYGRNRNVGQRLGQGESLETILETMDSVAEGITTTRSIFHLAEKRGIEMPITAEVYQVLFEGKSPLEATDSLMLRPPRDE